MIFEPKAKMVERPELHYLFQARRQLAGRWFNRNVVVARMPRGDARSEASPGVDFS